MVGALTAQKKSQRSWSSILSWVLELYGQTWQVGTTQSNMTGKLQAIWYRLWWGYGARVAGKNQGTEDHKWHNKEFILYLGNLFFQH